MLLGRVHHVDVLGEEHDLAHRAGELGGVVRGQQGLGLTDAAHHREDVLAGVGALRLLELGVGDHADEIVGARVGLDRANPTEAIDQARGERGLGGTDRAAVLVVELDRDVGDATGGDVGGDIHLLASHDAHLDDRATRLGEEARIGRRETGVFELVHERGERLLVVDPAEELPDRAEVLDRVDERRAGERHHECPRVGRADAAREREHVLAALRLEVLDEVRLVDDHALEAEAAEPADVAIEDLVVNDHDIAEGVDVVAVAMHDGGGATGSPQLDLTGPVRLDDVGHDHEKRIRVGCRRGQQRLRRLAQPGLVGEQERAVTALDLLDEARLVPHELAVAGGAQRARLGEVHRGRSPAGTVLEGAEQRFDELPAAESVSRLRARRDGAEVGGEEGVGHLHLAHRCGHDLLLDLLVDGLGLRRDDELVGAQLDAGGQEQVAAQRLRGGGHGSVIREHGDEARVARGGLGEDARETVEALLLVRALRLGERGVGLDASALLAQQQGGDLEPGAVRGLERSLLHGGLDLAGGAGEHGDDAHVIPRAHPAASGRGGGALTRGSLALLSLARLWLSGRCHVVS